MKYKNIIFLALGIGLGMLVVWLMPPKPAQMLRIYVTISAKENETNNGTKWRPEYYYGYNGISIAQKYSETYKVGLKGVVLQPKTAYKITYSILAAKYGKKFADGQKPYKISLLNDRVWQVASNNDSCFVYIQKLDARILRIAKYE